jgi:hypothetical protein
MIYLQWVTGQEGIWGPSRILTPSKRKTTLCMKGTALFLLRSEKHDTDWKTGLMALHHLVTGHAVNWREEICQMLHSYCTHTTQFQAAETGVLLISHLISARYIWSREYWMIYRGPGFLAVAWFGSSPTP